MGCYLTPYDASMVENIVSAIDQRPYGVAHLVAGDFNCKLYAPEGNCLREEITAVMVNDVLKYVTTHFLL